jgi:hypothetical protein
LGNQVKTLVKRQVGQLTGQMTGMSLGSGAYGRGAYGRGSYGLSQGQSPSVNSLFKEYDRRRHETFSAGDETGRTTISRREYVMRVTAPASTEFQNTSFSINPGLSGVFAWLSQIASNYDEYALKHLVFHYKPVISQASQTGTMGSILLSANYNAGATKFASFREMAEYSGSLETRICDEALFGVECDPTKHSSQPIEFIRSGSVPIGQDIKTYDLATFQLATSDVDAQSFPTGTLLGHLYVEYEVTLGKPKLFTALGKGILQDMWRSDTPCTNALPFGVNGIAIPNPANTMGVTLLDSYITFPDNFYGTVQVTYNCTDSSALYVTPYAPVGQVQFLYTQGPTGVSTTNQAAGATNSASNQTLINGFYSIQPAINGVSNQIRVFLAGTSAGNRGFCLTVAQSNPDFIGW